ncbi:hypothetical protein AFB00_23385 [Pseudonocardia sp. HH130630-07]|nr:hypothetical protein AFB00_23385 [Pseudonocardia sp. HH130630-07]
MAREDGAEVPVEHALGIGTSEAGSAADQLGRELVHGCLAQHDHAERTVPLGAGDHAGEACDQRPPLFGTGEVGEIDQEPGGGCDVGRVVRRVPVVVVQVDPGDGLPRVGGQLVEQPGRCRVPAVARRPQRTTTRCSRRISRARV